VIVTLTIDVLVAAASLVVRLTVTVGVTVFVDDALLQTVCTAPVDVVDLVVQVVDVEVEVVVIVAKTTVTEVVIVVVVHDACRRKSLPGSRAL
jgi:hypothetical protein